MSWARYLFFLATREGLARLSWRTWRRRHALAGLWLTVLCPCADAAHAAEIKVWTAAKPDISSVEAFRRALLAAKSIAHLKDVGSGIHVATLVEHLGIAEAIRAKVTRPETDTVSELVAKGEVELGLVVITQILTTPGVELVGPLPPDVQSYVTFAAGVSARSREPQAARSLINYLTGPIATPVVKAQGMEPGNGTPCHSQSGQCIKREKRVRAWRGKESNP